MYRQFLPESDSRRIDAPSKGDLIEAYSAGIAPKGIDPLHVGFDDPPKLAATAKTAGEAMAHYRRVRDEIRAFVKTIPDCLQAKKE